MLKEEKEKREESAESGDRSPLSPLSSLFSFSSFNVNILPHSSPAHEVAQNYVCNFSLTRN